MSLGYEKALARLAEHGQEHVLADWKSLEPSTQTALLRQIESLDLAGLAARAAAARRAARRRRRAAHTAFGRLLGLDYPALTPAKGKPQQGA